MKLYKTRPGIVLEFENQYYHLPSANWDELINLDELRGFLMHLTTTTSASDEYREWTETQALAPIGRQEVWASGVTYLRSRNARMEESKKSGGDNFYDRVYDAERPELFFKSTPERVVGPGDAVRIRQDSDWNVPEPELTLFITSAGKIAGYTCGNDMSSRSIEGENPLYLPQAKTYDGSAALGPCLYLPETPIAPETQIRLDIIRDDQAVFSGSIAIDQMKRQHTELVSYLFRECSFPNGCYLMTGTGIVPPDNFTLRAGDLTQITIDGIGTLENVVAA
ncbi:fumarylacetoacetate hydrolase family protein [Spirosoma utsteinense]|uniref:2-dehydro-3-deoxy-D-arabinonate dehydratase n=1 Tax=Spirosoma utsteinense TaxID=2585773 RepID=A0ABR6W041_9BACT|nr:fumarylacetoacetate hydrolase family protein [Spirosoma utsteinense]MBC3786598.1 2-dehydro-3-deoxy-D-arabinonate dehydratase [Spirosoma utsteinense]MBC3789976.1 2-dehydro-3-deoxy-D-arabinonate dehydratase [Spirosoma utsteinense]